MHTLIFSVSIKSLSLNNNNIIIHMIIYITLILVFALSVPNEMNIISPVVYFHANGSPLVDLEIQVCRYY